MIEIKDVPSLYKTEVATKVLKTKEYKMNYVDLEATMAACRQCPMYCSNWACPEFDVDVLEYWDKYENIELIFTKIIFNENALSKTYTDEDMSIIVDNSLFRERNKLLSTLVKTGNKYDGKCLSAVFCNFCESCSRLDNLPCKYPDRCHNSIESIGGLVTETLTGVFGEKLKWIDNDNGKLPENLSLLMAVLY